MTRPLDITFSTPLEREYEAWIIRGIEDYFLSLGKRISIWAVSPSDEADWPADEAMFVGTKIIGLQLKKVDYVDDGSRPKKFGRLRWTFHNPPNQFDLVLKFPEIYYCLPTFVNRNMKDQALSHCIFWRPDPKEKRNLNAWYDNKSAKTPYKSIGSSTRWGKFIEDIIECSVGKKIDTVTEAKNYLDSIKGYMREMRYSYPVMDDSRPIKINQYGDHRKLVVYIISIPINGQIK